MAALPWLVASYLLGAIPTSYLAGRPIPDLNSGQRVMRRDAVMRYLHLCPSGFSFTSTITLAMMANGHVVRFEPIDYARRTGTSKIRRDRRL